MKHTQYKSYENTRSLPMTQPMFVSSGWSWVEEWAPTAARIILGLVFVWFGANELLQPHLWTGYVPLLPSDATITVLLVQLHGGLLWLLATALLVGIAPRTAALISALMMIEIILLLLIGHGVSDIVARDFGVLGLALATFGTGRQRLLLR